MPNNQEIPENLYPVKEQLADRLFPEFPDLVDGIAIGLGAGEQRNNSQEILIFVEPVAECELEPLKQAVEKVAGKQFRLLPTGLFYALQSPAARGSVSYYAPSRFNVPQVAAGTLGAVAEIAAKKYAIGSNHVLAHNGRVPIGSPIVRPGTVDAIVKPANLKSRTIAHLSSFAKLEAVSWPPPPPGSPSRSRPSPGNRVDAALAEFTPGGFAGLTLIKVGAFPGSINRIAAPTPVMKLGRTTGVTHSQVCMVGWHGYIDMDFGSYYFEDLVAAVGNERPANSPFAGKGDSGALVVTDPAGQGIGLVTARAFNPLPGPYHGYIVLVCPVDRVLEELAPTIRAKPNQFTLSRLA